MLEKTKILEKKDIMNFSFDDVIELQKNLEFHSDLYYNKEVSQISDKEYDDLLKKLENLEEKFSIIFEEKNLEKKANKV
jgi:NAD-dependent DNA ligase